MGFGIAKPPAVTSSMKRQNDQMSYRRYHGVAWAGILLCLGGLVPFAAKVSAQDARRIHAAEVTHTFSLLGVPLVDALNLLIERTRIDLFYEQALVDGQLAYCQIQAAPREAVLGCILSKTTLDYYRLSSGVYVLTHKSRTSPAYGTLVGIVMDTNTLEPLGDVAVILRDARAGSATNSAGRFSFPRMKPGRYLVSTSHVAYEDGSMEVEIGSGGTAELRILLEPRVVMSAPIIVNGLYRRLASERLADDQIDPARFGRNLDRAAPADALGPVVGVHIGDALADVHVQGGAAGEHQYVLDGATVFMPVRNGGFFGSFSPFAIERVTVHKAGYEARHGSFLAGSIDLEHDLSATGESVLAVQMDPLSLNARLDGPTYERGGLRVDWMLAGRRGLWDLFQPRALVSRFREWGEPNIYLHQALAPEADFSASADSSLTTSPLSIGFYDVHAASRIRFRNGHSLHASLYRGHNLFGYDTPSEPSIPDAEDVYSWMNQAWQVRYEWVAGNRTFMHTGFARSEYRLSHPIDRLPFAALGGSSQDSLDRDLDDFNDIFTYTVRIGVDHALTDRHVAAGALEAVYTESEFSLSIDPGGTWPAITHDLVSPVRFRLQSFVEDTWTLSERTTITVGTRLSFLPAQMRLYAEPRFAWRHDVPDGPGGAWAFRLAAGLYRQFLNQFDVASYNPSALLPSFRFWIPVSRTMRASSAYHTAASALFMPSDAWKVRLETYYKYYPRLAVLDYASRLQSVPSNPVAGDVIEDARGFGYGFGLGMEREIDAFVLAARYDFSVARRRTSNRFDGRYLPTPWDVPHEAFLSLDYRWRNAVTASVRWSGSLGRTWGYRRAYYDYLEPARITSAEGIDFSHPDRHRLPGFSQMDLGLAYAHRIRRVEWQGRFNVINLLGRRNVLEWTLRERPLASVPVRGERMAFPFYPSFSLRAQF
jgi:CarboxypepD_reg-like domain